MARHYILNLHHQVVETDLSGWQIWVRHNPPNEPIARTEIANGFEVATYFLGTAKDSDTEGRPYAFETRIIHDLGSEGQWRHTTWERAMRGHDLVVANELTKLMDCNTELKQPKRSLRLP